MPLNALWAYNATDRLGDIGGLHKTCGVLALLCLSITTIHVIFWTVKDRIALKRLMEKERRAIAPHHNRLAGIIVVLPWIVSLLAFLCIIWPVICLIMELIIAILACVHIGCLCELFIYTLGEPPLPEKALAETSTKRWWCGPLCGGVNATMPGLGLVWSREDHKLDIKDIHKAVDLVQLFYFLFIASNAITVGVQMIPTELTQQADGDCISRKIFPILTTVAGSMAVTSSFVGMAGFAIISEACAEVEKRSKERSNSTFSLDVSAKSCAAQIYMLLPLLLPILLNIEWGDKSAYFRIDVPITENVAHGQNGTWTSSGRTITCTVYDQETLGHSWYALCVIVSMTYLANFNFRYFSPGEQTSITFAKMCSFASNDDDSETGTD